MQHTGPQFDVLVMDEAQDLCQSPYLEISDLALAGGLRRGRWAMFGDFTNQAIYLSRAADPERNLLQYCEHPARRNLYVNCRNTPPIARDTARVAGSAIPETRLREMPGPRPQYQYWQDAAELSDLLDEEVHRLLAEDVHIDEIVVLSAGRLDNTGLNRNRTYGSYPLADYSRGQRIARCPGYRPGCLQCRRRCGYRQQRRRRRPPEVLHRAVIQRYGKQCSNPDTETPRPPLRRPQRLHRNEPGPRRPDRAGPSRPKAGSSGAAGRVAAILRPEPAPDGLTPPLPNVLLLGGSINNIT